MESGVLGRHSLRHHEHLEAVAQQGRGEWPIAARHAYRLYIAGGLNDTGRVRPVRSRVVERMNGERLLMKWRSLHPRLQREQPPLSMSGEVASQHAGSVRKAIRMPISARPPQHDRGFDHA